MKWAILCVTFLLLSGCATYQQEIDQGLSLAKQGDWKKAESQFTDVLQDSPQDQLLYLLEVGALAQNQGDYQRSNRLLEQADQLSDTFFPKSFKNRAWALLTNPRQENYHGSGLERIYISYLKSLNYLALSEQADNREQRDKLRDSALVEARRIDNKLNEIQAQKPTYDDLNAKQDQAFYMKALSWLGNFYNGGRSTAEYAYRDDAWARYVEGLQYEISKQYDDARISYQDAAKLYEAGYAKQYGLSDMTAERAWLDTIRMMRKGSGWSQDEINKLIKAKLSPAMQTLLASYQQDDAELVILEHQGFIPDKSEMSLRLYADPRAYSLVLQPLVGGSHQQQSDAYRWFTMVYSDINPLNLLANYKAGGAWGAIGGVFTKRVIVGSGVWSQLKQAHLDSLLTQQFIRVTVPYYRRFTLDHQTPILDLKGSSQEAHSSQTIRMTSLADIAVQEQLFEAQRDIYEGLVRELLRSWLADRVARSVDDDTASLILSLLGQVSVFASSAADTRNWLTLPAQVRLTRKPLRAATYDPHYAVDNKDFSLGQIVLQPNEIKVWNLRNPN
ncbi:hypothetical protein [Marinomonas pollencensis]|uniref:Uncharacterized protein n=1 Tax=Marinomonas pollencensis TaxID=491954 RepID=A0A3E0DKN9_9GAMM|nr:hypothetical protein [Marinomonas pollencensis]REG82645.1 hypothetical protein DFP81_10879 [Marinomonas pollencensis]